MQSINQKKTGGPASTETQGFNWEDSHDAQGAILLPVLGLLAALARGETLSANDETPTKNGAETRKIG